MKTIEIRFKKLLTNHPDWSTYICFSEAIHQQNFNHAIICRWFNKLVNKDDYFKKDKKAILAFLKSI